MNALLPHGLATVNAVLNATACLLLLWGYGFIRQGRITAHKRCMLSAVAVSALFLISYVAHHVRAGIVYYLGHGWHRVLYFAVLDTHTPLAIAVVPLVLITLRHALGGRFDQHKRWAHWTFPIWLYVSLTGVVVYWMLYHPRG
ncbi:MAG: DUF420 domain-containing protein [Terriglobales bacterium]